MPGVTVVDAPPDDGVLDDVLASVQFTDAYARQDVLSGVELHVAHTGYDAYPVAVFETDECTLVLEGYLYGTDDVEATVTEVIPMLREERTDDLSDWVLSRDGDFLLIVVDDSDGTVWAVNDVFGRLPTYRATIDGSPVLTRELKAIRELGSRVGDRVEPDQLGLAQMLLFGYPLGTRTLFDGVQQLPPGSVLELGEDEARSLHEYRFDRHPNASRSIRENARVLKERFVEACRNRASVTDETVISLSGGLDSRSVIAGYSHVDGKVTAATSARKDGGNTAEVDCARKVARSLGIPWTSYIADRTPRHRAQLLDMTQGMNNVGLSIGLDFAEQVAAEHGSPMFVTGDGLSIPDRQPRKQVETTEELVDAIVTGKQVFSPDDIAAIVDVSPSELVQSVRERVDSYPEDTLDGKHLHYYFRERAINWLNHGEDRTRYYLWSTTPAYAPAFFAESMDCPPEQKRGSRLSRAFLTELAPPVVKIDYVDYKAPIDSLQYRVKRYAYEWLLDHPELKHRILPLFDRKDSGWDGNPPRELVYARNGASEAGKHVSMEEVQRITWSGGEYSSHQQNLLLTVVGAVSAESGTPIVPADG